MLGLANDQHIADLRASAAWTARSSTAQHEPPSAGGRRPIRRRTGWALVSVGLWLASADR
jgi:hypothetical protein